MKDKIQLIRNMRDEAADTPEKDAAGVYVPAGMDARIKRDTLDEVLALFEPAPVEDP